MTHVNSARITETPHRYQVISASRQSPLFPAELTMGSGSWVMGQMGRRKLMGHMGGQRVWGLSVLLETCAML